jgi:hypothetical protein
VQGGTVCDIRLAVLPPFGQKYTKTVPKFA